MSSSKLVNFWLFLKPMVLSKIKAQLENSLFKSFRPSFCNPIQFSGTASEFFHQKIFLKNQSGLIPIFILNIFSRFAFGWSKIFGAF